MTKLQFVKVSNLNGIVHVLIGTYYTGL